MAILDPFSIYGRPDLFMIKPWTLSRTVIVVDNAAVRISTVLVGQGGSLNNVRPADSMDGPIFPPEVTGIFQIELCANPVGVQKA